MSITSQDVEQLARMARLTLNEEEKEQYASQLNYLIAHIDRLKAIDTSAVTPTLHALPLQNVMRPDVSQPSWSKESMLANAPQTQEGFFHVPRIMEEE